MGTSKSIPLRSFCEGDGFRVGVITAERDDYVLAMITFRRLTDGQIEEHLRNQVQAPGDPPIEAAPIDQAPAGFLLDCNRIRIGTGAVDFELGRQALRQWKMFELDWLRLLSPECPVEIGRVVGVVIRQLGMTMVCPARIIETIDVAAADRSRFGFIYLALPDHIERGKERFQIVHDHADDSVWFEIQAMSRPRHWLLKLAYPRTRQMQKKFARDAMTALKRAVESARRQSEVG